MYTFAPSDSSAGVPSTVMRPPVSCRTLLRPAAAPQLIVPIILWPQPWPTSGRASYSHRKATFGPGFLLSYTDLKAVGLPIMFVSTENPFDSRKVVSFSTALNSWFPNSGLRHM